MNTQILLNRYLSIVATGCLVLSITQAATVPPAERLLPHDTLAVFCIPSVKSLNETSDRSPMMQLWRDPAMRPFRENFIKKFESTVVKPIEDVLQIKLADYTNLITGQFTIGFLNTENVLEKGPATILIADAGDKASQLQSNLILIRKKWVDGGNKLRTEKIRDVEFTVYLIGQKKLTEAFQKLVEKFGITELHDDLDETNTVNESKLYVGQKGSLLLVGGDPKSLEAVLASLDGSGRQTLSDSPSFKFCSSYHFRKSQWYLWINFRGIMDLIINAYDEQQKKAKDEESEVSVFAKPLSPAQIFDALGLSGVRAVSAAYYEDADGVYFEGLAYAPMGERKGLLDLLTKEKKDLMPPDFVSAEVATWARWRIDGAKFWNTMVKVAGEIMPFPVADQLIEMINSAMREKNPDFDFEKDFIKNLGDDFISYELPPRTSKPEDLASPPKIYLIGSGNPEKLVTTLCTIIEEMDSSLTVKKREFAGRQIYSVIPSIVRQGKSDKEPIFSFAAVNRYVAFSPDTALLEEFVRQKDPDTKLRENVQLIRALRKLELDTATGVSYVNNAVSIKAFLGSLKQNGGTVTNIADLFGIPLEAQQKEKLANWIDVTLLPSYDAISKYFHFQVTSLFTTPEAVILRSFAPTPPMLKK